MELLAILLGTGAGRLSVIELAESLLQAFGGLRGLLRAKRQDLENQQGLGPAKTAKLLAVLELSRRYLHEALMRSDPLESPEVTEQYLKSVFGTIPTKFSPACFWIRATASLLLRSCFTEPLTAPRCTRAWLLKKPCSMAPQP